MTEDLEEVARFAPGLGQVVATLTSFCEGSGALSVSVAIDQGDDLSPAVVRLDARSEVVEVSEGDRSAVIPDARSLGDHDPLARLHLHSFPPFEVDPEQGTVTGALGGLEHQARSVVALARVFGGRSVVSVTFPTAAGEPLEIGADAGGAVALSSGDAEFETPSGWPGD